MIKIAHKLHEKEKEKLKAEKRYFKAQLYYSEGNYKKAARLFNKIQLDEAKYMQAVSHLRLNNHKEALEHLYSYRLNVLDWPASDEKDDALEQIDKLRNILYK